MRRSPHPARASALPDRVKSDSIAAHHPAPLHDRTSLARLPSPCLEGDRVAPGPGGGVSPTAGQGRSAHRRQVPGACRRGVRPYPAPRKRARAIRADRRLRDSSSICMARPPSVWTSRGLSSPSAWRLSGSATSSNRVSPSNSHAPSSRRSGRTVAWPSAGARQSLQNRRVQRVTNSARRRSVIR